MQRTASNSGGLSNGGDASPLPAIASSSSTSTSSSGAPSPSTSGSNMASNSNNATTAGGEGSGGSGGGYYLTGDPSIDFTPEVRAAISELLPSNDHLDSASFNPIEYINELLPNEQALGDIDKDISRLKMKIKLLDEDIYKQIRLQSRAGTQGKQDLADAKSAITELFAKINDIKLKAEQSELMVQEICRDIKKLDYAKRHLSSTITALKRTHMLVTAVEQLKEMCDKGQYLHAGNLLEAVNQLSLFFTDYSHIPKIKLLQDTAADVKKKLKSKVYEEFQSVVEKRQMTIPNATQLSEVCFVIDALGQRARMDFMEYVTQSQLKEYKTNFRLHDESARLEFIDRRYLWIKKELKYYDEQFAKVFPSTWRLDEFLVEEFCVITKEMLIELLENKHKTLEVSALVQALQRTNEFERDMSIRFTTSSTSSGEKQDRASVVTNKFRGAISSAFDRYMMLYINQEDKLMQDKFEKAIKDETWIVSEEEANKYLHSSKDIVFYFNQTMKRGSALTKAQPFFELYKLFKKYFYRYAEVLKGKLPTYNVNEPIVKLNEREEKTICLIINTADYCQTMTTQLVDKIKRTINENFVDKIDMTTEQEEFGSIVAKGAKILVYGLETKLETALGSMTKMPWSTWDSVGDQSDYVTMISTSISGTVPLYKQWLSTTHFRFFCDAFISSFIPRLIQTLYKCKKISPTGAEQILLDMAACYDILKEIPNLGQEGGPGQARFVKFVKKEMLKVEMLLKVIITPQAGLVHSYKTLFPDGSEANFIKIMDLKGLKKNEQVVLLENLRQYEIQMKAEKKALKPSNA